MRQFKQESYYVLTEKEARTLIKECFGMPDYNIDEVEGWCDDSVDVYQVDLSNYDEEIRQDVARFVNDPETGNCGLHALLHELADRKEIPEGNYLIDICW